MGSKIKFGVVGCGAIHSTHCEAIQKIEGAELSAVIDCIPERAEAAGEKFGVRSFQSLASALDHLDAITIAVPSGHHHLVAIEAANAGKHVLSEKPIDIALGSALKMIGACQNNHVKLGVVSQHRFAHDVRQLKEAAHSGAMGRLLCGDMYNKWYRSQAYYDSGDWRGTWELDGGGCLMNQGVHYVDLLQWIMGGVASVQAQIRTSAHERIEVEDVANALLTFRNGAVGVIQGSTVAYPGLSERIEVHGLFGTAILEADRIKLWKVDPAGSQLGKYGDGVEKQPTPKTPLFGTENLESQGSTGASDPTAIWGEQHRLQIEDFVKAIADDRKPEVDGMDAVEPLKVILAIYQSAKEGGKEIQLNPPV